MSSEAQIGEQKPSTVKHKKEKESSTQRQMEKNPWKNKKKADRETTQDSTELKHLNY